MAILVAEVPSLTTRDTSCAVSLGSAPQGDALIAMSGWNAGTAATISGTGWTQIVDKTHGGLGARISCWYKVAGASEPTTITFSYGASVDCIGFVARLHLAASSPYINDSDGAEGSDDSVEAGSAGGSGSDMVLAFIYYAVGAVSITDYKGYDESAADGGDNNIAYVLTKQDTSATNPIFTTDTSGDWMAFNSGWDASPAVGMHHLLMSMGAR